MINSKNQARQCEVLELKLYVKQNLHLSYILYLYKQVHCLCSWLIKDNSFTTPNSSLSVLMCQVIMLQ